MADKVDPRTGELVTANYGWTKPTVGASTDAWGGYINADLDGIDSTVKSVSNAIPVASSSSPLMDGTAAAGTGTTWARADHVHPTDTSRAPLASPAFTGTPSMPTGATGVTQTAGDSSTKLATTAFVSTLPVAMNDNRIINGDMRIDQRNNGASFLANGYTVDRWSFFGTQINKITWGRNLNSAVTPAAFPYYLAAQTSAVYSSIATDEFVIFQRIEADTVSDFAWGTASAQPVTLSFWAFSSFLTGTFSGSLKNIAGTRSYPFSFSLPTINTWTRIVIIIPGDTAGTWVMSGNAGSLAVCFDLGGGSNYRAAANAWASGNYDGVTGAVNLVGSSGAAFYLTGVKLEIGSIATPFNRQSLAKSMADCQRYYRRLGGASNGIILTNYAPSAGVGASGTLSFLDMRATPTATVVGVWTLVNCGTPTISGMSFGTVVVSAVASAAGPMQFQTAGTTTYIDLTAEL